MTHRLLSPNLNSVSFISLQFAYTMIENQRSDAVRTDNVTLGSNGQIFWKLSGYNSRSNIILQGLIRVH